LQACMICSVGLSRRLGICVALMVLVLARGAQAQPAEPSQAPSGFWERSKLTGDWDGLRSKLEQAGVDFELQEQSELWANLFGGLNRGITYDGLTTPSLRLNLETLVGWSGATFFINAFQIHGRGPSANLVGNMQLVSNIEATRDTKLYDLWLEQVLLGGRVNIRLGQEGSNDEMMLVPDAALFLNSSFGFPALPASDLPSGGPNYPMATPFVRVRYRATDQITLVGAVYNGDPAPLGTGDPQLRDAGGTAFRVNAHALAFGEIWYVADKVLLGLPATYKLGAWYQTGHFADQVLDEFGIPLASPASDGIAARQDGHDYAVYGIVDQMVWRRPGTNDQGIGLFLQVMGAPGNRNLSNLAIEAGLNWKAPFAGRDNDALGLAVSYQDISPAARSFSRDVVFFTGTGSPYATNETVVEATYLYQVTPWWTLQPDAQYVINPGAGITTNASGKPLRNALIVGVRATITF
jgi:porin